MNEVELAQRVDALEAFAVGSLTAHRVCLEALFAAVDSTKAPIICSLLADLARSRPALPEAEARYFDQVIEDMTATLAALSAPR